MKLRLGRMTVGDILDRGLKMMFSRLGTFFVLTFLIRVPEIILQIVQPLLAQQGEMGAFVASLGVLLVQVIVSVTASTFATAAVAKIVEQEFIDEKYGIGAALSFAASRFLPLLGVSIIFGLMVGIGFVLCAIPGIILYCMFLFCSQAVVLEDLGPGEALTRSSELTRNHRWRIFGLAVIIGIVVLIVIVGIGILFTLVLVPTEIIKDARGFPKDVRTNMTNHVIQTLVVSFFTTLVSTYQMICFTLMYFDLRTRKEGFDLELAARGLPQPDRDDEDYDDEDDDRPRRGRVSARDDEDDDDRPRRRRESTRDDDDDDDRPRRRRESARDDDDDDRPRRRRDDDDEPDRDPPRPRRRE